MDDDSERDRRSGSQWLRSIKGYLEWRAGLAWRRGEDRNSPERWQYLDALRLLNGIGRPVPAVPPICVMTPKTVQDIRLASLASWPVARLVDQLMQLSPTLTDRRILTHLSRLKLARMLMDARAKNALTPRIAA
jgi:hypothetical protein